MIYKGREYAVRSSIGSGMGGIVLSHLVLLGSTKTLCGRDPKNLSRRYQFITDSDCKRCLKTAARLEVPK